MTHSQQIKRFNNLMARMVAMNEFVHEILIMMDKIPDFSCPTMGVRVEGSRVVLVYNPKFFDKLSDEEAYWVLQHEVYHVVLHHCTKRQPENPREHKLFNVAGDLAINCIIATDATCKRPDWVLIPQKYGFEAKLSMEKYVSLLRDKCKSPKGGSGGDSPNGKGKDKNSSGGSGGDSPNGEMFGKIVDDHSKWKESPLIGEIIRSKIEEIKRKERIWGNVSGDIKILIEAAQKAEINWRKQLRIYIGLSTKSDPENTRKKPHRRYGYTQPGTKRVCVDTKLLAIDSSGSVSDKMLSQFLSEMNKAQERSPIDLVVFDTKIHQGPVTYKKKVAKLAITGRGGTNFQGVFDLAGEKKYKTVIVLTDGEASAPTKPKCVKDVIWCLTKNDKAPVEWGRSVHLKSV